MPSIWSVACCCPLHGCPLSLETTFFTFFVHERRKARAVKIRWWVPCIWTFPYCLPSSITTTAVWLQPYPENTNNLLSFCGWKVGVGGGGRGVGGGRVSRRGREEVNHTISMPFSISSLSVCSLLTAVQTCDTKPLCRTEGDKRDMRKGRVNKTISMPFSISSLSACSPLTAVQTRDAMPLCRTEGDKRQLQDRGRREAAAGHRQVGQQQKAKDKPHWF